MEGMAFKFGNQFNPIMTDDTPKRRRLAVKDRVRVAALLDSHTEEPNHNTGIDTATSSVPIPPVATSKPPTPMKSPVIDDDNPPSPQGTPTSVAE
eukprot:4514970-Amphidinium_carterae.2